MEQSFSLAKSVGYRFFRGFVAGAVSTMLTVGAINAKSLNDLYSWLGILGLALIVGGITGGLMAVDKYLRAEPTE